MNRNLSNTELMAIPAVKAAVESGSLVLIDKVQTANPEYTNLYFFGNVEGLGGASAEVSAAAAELLGWNSSYQDRCIQNSKTAIANTLVVGQEFKNFAIRIVDSTVPQFQGQQFRKDGNDNVLYHEGKPIYRTRFLVTKDELATKGHSTLAVSERKAEIKQGVEKNILQGEPQA